MLPEPSDLELLRNHRKCPPWPSNFSSSLVHKLDEAWPAPCPSTDAQTEASARHQPSSLRSRPLAELFNSAKFHVDIDTETKRLHVSSCLSAWTPNCRWHPRLVLPIPLCQLPLGVSRNSGAFLSEARCGQPTGRGSPRHEAMKSAAAWKGFTESASSSSSACPRATFCPNRR